MDQLPSGKILTFYSYKGGTGRSMALVNFGCWLARRDIPSSQRVLLIDWDLEAPGLHRYFPATDGGDSARQGGLIDFFWAIHDALEIDGSLYDRIAAADGSAALRDAFPLTPYISRDVLPGVDLIRAGRFENDYPQRVSSFNWIDFHGRHGQVFRSLREMIATDYSYCLIDSRTGFNDVSGVCTMLMPEKLVLVFTPSRQSLSGVLDLAARAVNYRRSADDFRPLAIYPLPSRIENAELELKQRWRKIYQNEFEATLTSVYQLDNCELTDYFDDVLLPHVSFYSFGEEIALLREKHSDALSLRRAYDSFFRRLETTEFAWDGFSGAAQPIESKSVSPPVERADVFISYAHIDNQPQFGESRGWIDVFCEALEMQLAQMLGIRVRLWRDLKLSGGDDILSVDATAQAVRAAKCFVAILSPAYVRSRGCQRELQMFLEPAGPELDRGQSAKLLKVKKWPLARTEEPPALRDYLGYNFYSVDPDGLPRELTFDMAAPESRIFMLSVRQLAFDISKLLQADSTHEPRVSASSTRTIYVAETSTDIRRERDKIISTLKSHGYGVLPDAILPTESEAVQTAIREYLARCDVSVHMLGERYGLIPEGDDRSVVQLQWELAAERSLTKRSFSRILWAPPDLVHAERRLSEFVKQIEHTPGPEDEILRTDLKRFEWAILARLAARAEPPRRSDDRSPPLVYLICDSIDAAAALPITRYFHERGGDVITSRGDDHGPNARRNVRNLLKHCDVALIYYGLAHREWLVYQLTELAKATARRMPIGVVLGPPNTPEKQSLRTGIGSTVIDATEHTPDEALGKFVEAAQYGTSGT